MFPTLLELTGLPSDDQQEGQSLVPLVKQPTRAWNHPAITSFGAGNFAVRSARYRFIEYHDGSRELYDTKNDPHEWTNLATNPEFTSVIEQHAAFMPAEQHSILPDNSTGQQAYAATAENMTE